jgi:hypothetical protein
MSTINKQFLVRTGVNLPASDGTHAPLTFQEGTNLPDLASGSVEWDGYNLYVSEKSTNGTFSGDLAALVRRTVAYTDSTMLSKTEVGIEATGTSQLDSTVVTKDNSVIINSTNDVEPYNGIRLPPAVTGRKVRIVNASLNPIAVYPLSSPSDVTVVSSSGTTVTVNTTNGLFPGMKVTVITGTGLFQPNTTVTSILSGTTFAVDKVPSESLLSGATVRAGNSNTSINSLSANNAYTMNNYTAVEFIAASDNKWYTTAATLLASNNGITGKAYTPGDVIYASTPTDLEGLNDVAIGSVLLSGGLTTAPFYGKVELDGTVYGVSHINGILPPENGGTGTNGTSLLQGTGITTYNLVNSGVTTLNIGGDATQVNIGDAIGTTTINHDLTVVGNLIVKGSQTIVNTTNTSIKDSVIDLHKPLTGYLTVDDGYDIGVKYNYYKAAGDSVVVTGGTASGGTATLTVGSNYQFNIGQIITVSGVDPVGFNGTYKVTNSTSNSVSFASSLSSSVITTGALGTVTRVTQLEVSSGTYAGAVATINYTGPALTDGDVVTLTNNLPEVYNGTFVISNAASGAFNITLPSDPASNITQTGLIIIDQRYAFSGVSNNDGIFEFYKDGQESAASTFSGSYGAIKAGTFIASPEMTASAVDLTSGVALKIPTNSFYDIDTVASGTVTQGAIARIDQQTIGSVNTGVTYSSAASLYISNAPLAGSNVTITNPYAIQVEAGNTLLGGDLAVNGGDITSTATTFELLNQPTTVNAFRSATSINIGEAGTVISVGKNTGNSVLELVGNSTTGTVTLRTTIGVTTANVFASVATGNLFDGATDVNIANIGTAGRTIDIATSATDAASILKFGGLTSNNRLKIESTGTGTVNLETGVTSGVANVFTSVTGTVNLGGAATTVKIGAETGNAILSVSGNDASGIATITTNVTSGSATVFPSVTGVVSVGNNAATLQLTNAGTAAKSVQIATGSSAASTMLFGGAITSGTNSIKVGGTTGGVASFDTNTSGVTAALFPTTTSGTVKLAENATTVTLQNTTTSATTLTIAGATGNNNNTLTYGGLTTTGTNRIAINTGSAGNATFDATNAASVGNVFPTITGTTNYSANAATVTIANTGTAARTVNIATAATAAASTLKFGGAVTGNTLTIGSTPEGTVKLTTDVTTGKAEVFPAVTGEVVIGGTTISSGNGVVKLGTSPNINATGTEVVTAEWILNRIQEVNTISKEFTTLATNQIFDLGFNWGMYRSAKYTIQATQVGTTSTRTQTSEILLTTDAPVFTISGVTSNTATLPVTSTAGVYVGMTVVVVDGTGALPAGTTVESFVTDTSITLSNAPTTALTAATIRGTLVGNYVSTASASNAADVITVNSTTNLYPGMGVVVTSDSSTGVFESNTFVTEIISSTSFRVSSVPTIPLSSAIITGTPNIYITEYATLETNGTVAAFSADTTATNVRLIVSPQGNTTITNSKLPIGTVRKTVIKAERQLIELT